MKLINPLYFFNCNTNTEENEIEIMVDADNVAIASLIVSSVGVVIAFLLTLFVIDLNKKQRKRDEIYYETQTKSYVHSILNHFVEIDRLSTPVEPEEIEEEVELENESTDQIILYLDRYYKQNHKKMAMLLDNVKSSLEKWSSLDHKKRGMYADIIEDFKWIVEDYFSTAKEKNMQFRMWNTQHKTVSKKRYDIDNKIELLSK